MKKAAYKSLRDFWQSKKQEFIASCDHCGKCMDICPVRSYTELAQNDAVTASERFLSFLETGQDVAAIANFMNACLRCGYCAEVCPMGHHLHHIGKEFVYVDLEDNGYGVRKIWREIPENPEDIWKFYAAINPKPQERYDNFVMKIPENPPQTDLVYYVSCATAAFPQRLNNMMGIIKATGNKFVALSPFDNDLCCGAMHLMSGMIDIAERRAKQLVDAIKKYKPKTVILGCLHTHYWLRDFVSEFYPFDFKPQNHVQFIADNMEKLTFKKNLDKITVTYHDSCGIGKWAREWEAPRKILNSLPGVNFVEMPRNRNNAACCGLAAPKELQDRMINDRLQEAKKTGATCITSVCAGCNMGFMMHKDKYGITAQNIESFVAERLGYNFDDPISKYKEIGNPDLIYPLVQENLKKTPYVNYSEKQVKKLLKRYFCSPRTMGLHDDQAFGGVDLD